MRILVGMLLLVGACAPEGEPQGQGQASQAAVPAAELPAAAAAMPAQSPVPAQSAMMAIPDDREALKRLEAMGYTIHAEQGHLHAPGVNSCPQMGDGPVM